MRTFDSINASLLRSKMIKKKKKQKKKVNTKEKNNKKITKYYKRKLTLAERKYLEQEFPNT